MKKNVLTTSTPVRSEKVIKLISLGKAESIAKAIENEKKSNSHVGHSDGIAVRRLGFARK